MNRETDDRWSRWRDQLRERPRRWLVTGAAGFIGSTLVERLLAEGRELVYQSEMFRTRRGGSWSKSQLLLFSDLLLLVDLDPEGRLRVSDSPIYVHDIAGIEVNRKYGEL